MALVRAALLLAGLVFTLFASSPSYAAPMLDVVIVMDASDSVTSTGWTNEEDFVIRLIEDELPRGRSKVGVVEFASDATIEVPLTALDSSTEPAIMAKIAALRYSHGSTATESAVNAALDIFDADPDPSNPKLMILVTDGNPSPSGAQNPCDTSGRYPQAQITRNRLAAASVTGLLVAVGRDVDKTMLACLYNNDPKNFIPAGAWSDADLSAVLGTVGSDITMMPEPAGWTVLVFGLGALIYWRRRDIAG